MCIGSDDVYVIVYMEQVKFYATSDIEQLKDELKKRNLSVKGSSRADLVERLKLDDMERRKELGIVEIFARTKDNVHRTIFISKDKYLEDLQKEVVEAYGFDLEKVVLFWRTYDEPIETDYVVNYHGWRKVWRKIDDGSRVGNVFGLNGLPLLVLVDGV